MTDLIFEARTYHNDKGHTIIERVVKRGELPDGIERFTATLTVPIARRDDGQQMTAQKRMEIKADNIQGAFERLAEDGPKEVEAVQKEARRELMGVKAASEQQLKAITNRQNNGGHGRIELP